MNWSDTPQAPEDSVYVTTRLFNECQNPQKVSLGVGAYRDENGKPYVLQAVVKAKEAISSLPPQQWTHEYQPISGHARFLESSQKLLFGPTLHSQLAPRLTSLQTLSGTGACRLAFAFLARFSTNRTIALPDPTWANHAGIARDTGLTVTKYTYLDKGCVATPRLDYEGLRRDLRGVEEGAIVVLHLCAHNPTGVDPSLEQWEGIADVCKERKLVPLIDNAYQGFASGNLEKDAKPLRVFIDKGLTPLIACSFAKNMGLYGERVGALHIVTPDASCAAAVQSQLKLLARAMYSNPPQFGAMVAHRVLSDEVLRGIWEKELEGMANRIKSMRGALRDRLEGKLGGDWSHITQQIGMFSYTGLTEQQVGYCTENGVFMLKTGRISMAGLNEGNIDYAAGVMADAIKAFP